MPARWSGAEGVSTAQRQVDTLAGYLALVGATGGPAALAPLARLRRPRGASLECLVHVPARTWPIGRAARIGAQRRGPAARRYSGASRVRHQLCAEDTHRRLHLERFGGHHRTVAHVRVDRRDAGQPAPPAWAPMPPPTILAAVSGTARGFSGSGPVMLNVPGRAEAPVAWESMEHEDPPPREVAHCTGAGRSGYSHKQPSPSRHVGWRIRLEHGPWARRRRPGRTTRSSRIVDAAGH